MPPADPGGLLGAPARSLALAWSGWSVPSSSPDRRPVGRSWVCACDHAGAAECAHAAEGCRVLGEGSGMDPHPRGASGWRAGSEGAGDEHRTGVCAEQIPPAGPLPTHQAVVLVPRRGVPQALSVWTKLETPSGCEHPEGSPLCCPWPGAGCPALARNPTPLPVLWPPGTCLRTLCNGAALPRRTAETWPSTRSPGSPCGFPAADMAALGHFPFTPRPSSPPPSPCLAGPQAQGWASRLWLGCGLAGGGGRGGGSKPGQGK